MSARLEPEVLAQHLTEAGLAERAIPYWRRAGELAAGRSANLEAIAHLSKGLELVGTLPDAPEHLDEELALRMAIGGPLIATKGYPAPEVERTYSRAWALCDQLGRSAELFPVLRGLWNCYFVRGELQRAHDLAERLVALAEEQGTPLRRALARRALRHDAVLPRPVCRCDGSAGRGHRDRRCGRGLGGSCSPSALHGARRRRVPAVFGMGPLVPRLSRPRPGEDRSRPRPRPTARARQQPRLRPELGRSSAQLPTRV